MKIILCSDTHGKHDDLNNDLPEADMIIHSGDITSTGRENEVLKFLDWFGSLPYKHKIFIAGNHDFYFEAKLSAFPPIYTKLPEKYNQMGITYLMDEMVEIEGLKIYGSPWQPFFYDWAFNLNRGYEIAKVWEKIPKKVDILITHGPPYGILDYTPNYLNVGCEELYKRIIKVKPKIHVFGHIHFARGHKNFNNIDFFNASVLNKQYSYSKKPFLITLNNKKELISIEQF